MERSAMTPRERAEALPLEPDIHLNRWERALLTKRVEIAILAAERAAFERAAIQVETYPVRSLSAEERALQGAARVIRALASAGDGKG